VKRFLKSIFRDEPVVEPSAPDPGLKAEADRSDHDARRSADRVRGAAVETLRAARRDIKVTETVLRSSHAVAVAGGAIQNLHRRRRT
jgi:tellurite resistance protein